MTSRRHTSLLGIAGGFVLLLAGTSLLVAAPKAPQKGEKDKAADTAAKVGEKAPDFTLKDTDGKEHRLSDYTKDGKIVVLEWFNPGCPFIQLHHEKQTTFVDLYKDFKDKNVVVLAVNSTNSGNRDFGKDAEAKKKWKIDYPILLDTNGKVGHMYGAKTTPHTFVIDKKGMQAYSGAIDNDPRNQKTGEDKVNYVRAALADLKAGKKVAKSDTKPYGCSVKY